MNDEEIQEDIQKRKRKTNIIMLRITSIILSIIFSPVFLLFGIWLHPKKDEYKLFVNRIKNYKSHIIRIILSILVLLLTLVVYSGKKAAQEQERLEQEQVAKIESTILNVSYDINTTVTDRQDINIQIETKNINKLIINNKEINITNDNIELKEDLEMWINTFEIIWYNDDIQKSKTIEIERVSTDELTQREQERIEQVEREEQERVAAAQEQQRQAEIAARDKKVEAQFSAWDGSHITLTRFLKDNYLKDPKSYEHIETRYAVVEDEAWDYVTVITSYRAKNSFGWYVIWSMVAYFDIDGNPIKIDEWISE